MASKDGKRSGINSKAKGSDYERKIAKVLGDWYGEEFHRTPASGGLHWKEDNRVAGDIVTPPGSTYPFVTELKKRESWEFFHLLKGTGEMEKFWQQVSNDAARTGLKPLLVFSKNFSPDYTMMLLSDFTAIFDSKGWTNNVAGFNYFVVHKAGSPDRVTFILQDFLRIVSKEDIIKAYGL